MVKFGRQAIIVGAVWFSASLVVFGLEYVLDLLEWTAPEPIASLVALVGVMVYFGYIVSPLVVAGGAIPYVIGSALKRR
jgi:hypothetical protein